MMSKKEELEAQGYKTYENDEILVFWNPSVCAHAAKCVTGNKDVFDPQRRPWIDLTKAPAKEIAAIIDKCPSRALQYELKDAIKIVFDEDMNMSAAFDKGTMIGECEYSDSGTTWIISHTSVKKAYEGRGFAKRLVLKVIEAARERGVKIIPLCPYAKKMMMADKEAYSDVLRNI